jgi:hypothetical protein
VLIHAPSVEKRINSLLLSIGILLYALETEQTNIIYFCFGISLTAPIWFYGNKVNFIKIITMKNVNMQETVSLQFINNWMRELGRLMKFLLQLLERRKPG